MRHSRRTLSPPRVIGRCCHSVEPCRDCFLRKRHPNPSVLLVQPEFQSVSWDSESQCEDTPVLAGIRTPAELNHHFPIPLSQSHLGFPLPQRDQTGFDHLCGITVTKVCYSFTEIHHSQWFDFSFLVLIWQTATGAALPGGWLQPDAARTSDFRACAPEDSPWLRMWDARHPLPSEQKAQVPFLVWKEALSFRAWTRNTEVANIADTSKL